MKFKNYLYRYYYNNDLFLMDLDSYEFENIILTEIDKINCDNDLIKLFIKKIELTEDIILKIIEYSCIWNNRDIISYFIENNYDIYSDEIFDNLIIYNHIDLLKYIITKNQDIFMNYYYNDCVVLSCLENKLEILKYLISLNNNFDYSKYIFYSYQSNNLEILKYFIKNIKDYNLPNNLLHEICKTNNLDILKFYISNCNSLIMNKILFMEICHNQNKLEMFKYLIEKKIIIITSNLLNKYIIVNCLFYMNFDLFKFLVKNYKNLIDIQKIDINDFLPIFIKKCDIDFIKFLIFEYKNYINIGLALTLSSLEDNFYLIKYFTSIGGGKKDDYNFNTVIANYKSKNNNNNIVINYLKNQRHEYRLKLIKKKFNY